MPRSLIIARAIVALMAINVWPLAALAERPANRPWFGQVEAFGSLVGDLGDRDLNGTSFGPGIKVGHRWGAWGMFATVEHNAWVIDEGTGAELQPGALNIGVGGEFIYAERYLRASIALGPSILLYDTHLDSAGSTGIFVDARPAGIRWPVAKQWVLMCDPLSFVIVGPVLTGIPLILMQFRTTVGLEYQW